MELGLEMDRKEYSRDIYPKYWITSREKVYGFRDYDKNLCCYICKNVPKKSKLLEVAIGTGYPIAGYLSKNGYSISGVDISPLLVEKCRELYPTIDARVGDAEELDHPDAFFDCTYCFSATWLFPNLEKVIDEMLRVTRQGGLVTFDIENRNNKKIESHYKGEVFLNTTVVGKTLRYVAYLLRKLRRGNPTLVFIVHQVPTYPESIYEHLANSSIADFQVLVANADESIEPRNELSAFKEFGNLIFVVRK